MESRVSRIIGIFATLALLGATAAADRASKDCPDCPETRTKDRAFDAFPLAKMDLKKMTCGSGQARKCLANEGAPLTLGGKTYTCGVGTHAPSPTQASSPSSAASTARKSAAHEFPHPSTIRRAAAS